MRFCKVAHLTLLALFVAALGVPFAFGATTTKPAAKKKAAVKSTSTSARKGKASKKTSRRDRGQKAPTADRITEIQSALAKNGAYAGKPNGKWDDATVEAMKSFQGSRGLNPSGKLDAKTLQQLGLGSATAGIAPPIPQVKVSSTAVPQTDSSINTKQ